MLAVHGAGLSVGVGDIGVAFLNLDFILLHQEDAAISSFLSVDFTVGWDSPFDVELAIAEALFGAIIAG